MSKAFLLFFAVFIGMTIGIESKAYSTNLNMELLPIDAVFVLDVSLSMITADPNRLANEAMTMFIDKLQPGRDRIGVVAYAGHITYSRELTLITDYNIAYLQDSIRGLDYASWTDHPLGLLEAIRILSNHQENDRQPIIIFLTDGNFNINPLGARTVSQADYDKALAITQAQQLGYPIFSIGLNFDGALDRRYIEIVADVTGGLAFETANAEDLPEILESIFYLFMYTMLDVTEVNEKYSPQSIDVIKPIQSRHEFTYDIKTNNRVIWQASLLSLMFLVVTAVVVCKSRFKKRRVFTGYVSVKIVDYENPSYSPVKYVSLIEFGNKVSVLQLIGTDFNNVLGKIFLIPSQTAPSHLPQIVLKCTGASRYNVKLLQNFAECDYLVSVSAGAAVDIVLENHGKIIRLSYITTKPW